MTSLPHSRRAQPCRRILFSSDWESSDTMRAILHFARQAHWIVDIVEGLLPHARLFKWQGAIALLPAKDAKITRFVRSARIPVVDIGPWRFDLPLPRVTVDDAAIGRMAAQHLLERGFNDLAYYYEHDAGPFRLRKEAFANAVATSGRRFHLLGMESDLRMLSYHHLMRRIRSMPKPIGIFAGCDQWARNVANACMLANVAVPDQVAIIGADNTPETTAGMPLPVSSVTINFADIGHRAAELLQRLMDGAPSPHETILIQPSGIAVRESTDIMHIEHPAVARALAFIRDHSHEQIRLPDVARAAQLTPGHLLALFNKHLGRTVLRHIDLRRLDHACIMLRETRSSMDIVAEKAGFPSAERMGTLFRRELATTPSEYRRRNTMY